MSGVSGTELKIIDWLKGERKRASKLWPFLRSVAENKDNKYDHGDFDLGNWVADLLDGSALAEIHLSECGADLGTARTLVRELTGGRDGADWLEGMDPMVLRVFLLQINKNDKLYVHSLLKGMHPGNRYWVEDENTVYETGWTSPVAAWGLAAQDRQICDEPIGKPCSCRIQQRQR